MIPNHGVLPAHTAFSNASNTTSIPPSSRLSLASPSTPKANRVRQATLGIFSPEMQLTPDSSSKRRRFNVNTTTQSDTSITCSDSPLPTPRILNFEQCSTPRGHSSFVLHRDHVSTSITFSSAETKEIRDSALINSPQQRTKSKRALFSPKTPSDQFDANSLMKRSLSAMHSPKKNMAISPFAPQETTVIQRTSSASRFLHSPKMFQSRPTSPLDLSTIPSQELSPLPGPLFADESDSPLTPHAATFNQPAFEPKTFSSTSSSGPSTPPPVTKKVTCQNVVREKNYAPLSYDNVIKLIPLSNGSHYYNLNGTNFTLQHLGRGCFHDVFVAKPFEVKGQPLKKHIQFTIDSAKNAFVSTVNLADVVFKAPLERSRDSKLSPGEISAQDLKTFRYNQTQQLCLEANGFHFPQTYLLADPADGSAGKAIVQKIPHAVNVYGWAIQKNRFEDLSSADQRLLSKVKNEFTSCVKEGRIRIPDFKPSNVRLDNAGNVFIIDNENNDSDFHSLDDIRYDLFEWASLNENIFKYLIQEFEPAFQEDLIDWYYDGSRDMPRKRDRLDTILKEAILYRN